MPAGIDFATSGLGIATCRPAQRDLLDVLARGHDLRPCPANAVLGRGKATAAIYYSDVQTVAASGSITLYNGPPVNDRPGVVAYVLTQHPIRSQLVYAGGLFNAPRPFGIGLRLTLPALPNSPFGAPISAARLTSDLGGEDIVYYELKPWSPCQISPWRFGHSGPLSSRRLSLPGNRGLCGRRRT